MARLEPKERAALPDRAFAYVDSAGRRRLPLHDAAHVRNALARFGQVAFEDDAAREEARMRLLKAAKRFRIVPVGFLAAQFRSERDLAGRAPAADLPTGFVTMLMTDVEDSSGHVGRLGDAFATVMEELCSVQRTAVERAGGCEIEARADEFFAVFADPRAAVTSAVEIQRGLASRPWPGGAPVRVRIGIHSGYPTRTARNYVGLDVHTAARICAAAHGEQIVVSGNTREAANDVGGVRRDGALRFRSLGSHRLRGIPGEVALYQVGAHGLRTRFPPLRGLS